MKRSELLTIMGIALLSALLFINSGQLSWAAPDQTPHMQTVPPRPPDEGEEQPPAPPEEPATDANEPPAPAEDSPSQSDNSDNNGGSPTSQDSPQADPVAEPAVESPAEVNEDDPTQPETEQAAPQTEPGDTAVEPEANQANGAGAAAEEIETGTTSGATVADDAGGIVEEPEAATVDPQNSPSQNVAFEEKVSAISEQAEAEAPAEAVAGEIVAPEAAGFPLYWLVALGVGLVLIVTGTIIIKRA